jgi:hypothetical protein
MTSASGILLTFPSLFKYYVFKICSDDYSVCYALDKLEIIIPCVLSSKNKLYSYTYCILNHLMVVKCEYSLVQIYVDMYGQLNKKCEQY